MKIVELNIRNLRKIEAVDILPSSNVVKIEGKNNNGKTTVLDSILLALGGGKIPDGVIKTGEDKSLITVKFGDYIVKKTITPTNAYLSVETVDGMKPKNPQSFLSDLIGKIAFDPMEFIRMDSKKQVDVLKKVLGIEEKINKLKEEELKAMEDRKLVGREKERYETLCLNELTPVEPPVSSVEISKKIQDAMKVKESISGQLKDLNMLKKSFEENKSEIDKLEQQLEALRDNQLKIKNSISAHDVNYAEKELNKLEKEIAYNQNILEKNDLLQKEYNDYLEYVKNKRILKEKISDWIQLDSVVENIRKEIKKTIEECSIPIKGLELSDNELLYNGHSFANTCESDRVKISVALTMAMNSKLKVILIRDGSLLDEDSLKEISDIANKEDYQIWIEKVASEKDDDSAIFIVEGEVK